MSAAEDENEDFPEDADNGAEETGLEDVEKGEDKEETGPEAAEDGEEEEENDILRILRMVRWKMRMFPRMTRMLKMLRMKISMFLRKRVFLHLLRAVKMRLRSIRLLKTVRRRRMLFLLLRMMMRIEDASLHVEDGEMRN